MDTPLTGQIAQHWGWQRIVVIAAVIALFFTTATLAAPCRPQTQLPPAHKAAVNKVVAAKIAAAKTSFVGPVAAAMHAVVQAATANVPRKAPCVRAAVAQALMRLPTTPLVFLSLLLLICIAAVPVYKRAQRVTDNSHPLPHGQCRALLQVFLI